MPNIHILWLDAHSVLIYQNVKRLGGANNVGLIDGRSFKKGNERGPIKYCVYKNYTQQLWVKFW